MSLGGGSCAIPNQADENRGEIGNIPVHQTKTILIRNNRLAVGHLFLAAILCMLATPCAIVVALMFLFPHGKLSFNRMYEVVAWACGAYLLGNLGLFLYRQASNMLHNRVRLNETGVTFEIVSGKLASEEFFAWEDIRAVTCRRIAHVCVCTVQGSRGRVLGFDSYTFLRPKHIARLITSRVETERPAIREVDPSRQDPDKKIDADNEGILA